MKNLLDIIFKKDSPSNYMVEEYQSEKKHTVKSIRNNDNSNFELENSDDDEMQIDKIYQSL